MTPAARFAAIALALVSSVTLAACAPTVVTQPDVTYTQVPVEGRSLVPSAPPDPKPAVVWPLTGLSAVDVDPAVVARSALAVKIENSYAAKPQTNLQYADTVYETFIDYGVSRLIAVFHSNWPETVGPIRSVRPMDHNIVGSYNGPLIFSGAQRRFISAADEAGQDLIAQDLRDAGFFRVNTNYAPHNLHGLLEEFAAQAEPVHSPPDHFNYAYPGEFNSAAIYGVPTAHIDIYMSPSAQPEWKWDAERALWLRYERTTPHVTYDGTQLYTDNVVILWAQVKYTTQISRGLSVPETLVAGRSGTGWVASEGMFLAVKWSKQDRFSPFVLTLSSGEPVYLKPGNTWVELVPSSGTAYKSKVEFR